METKIFVEGNAIFLEFTLADDCKFGVCLDEAQAKEMLKKLEEAIVFAGHNLNDRLEM